MLPRISPIQKCMNCGAYFFISDADKKRGTEYSFDLGLLSLEECKEAIEQLTAEGITKKKNLPYVGKPCFVLMIYITEVTTTASGILHVKRI